METNICGYILPKHDWHLTPDSECLPCLLKEGHGRQHLCKTPNGNYILWEFDNECTDCEELGEECECFTYIVKLIMIML